MLCQNKVIVPEKNPDPTKETDCVGTSGNLTSMAGYETERANS